MDLKAYIESGILELYVMQALPPEEHQEVERMAAQHPEIKAEITRIQSTMDTYAEEHAMDPRADLKTEIFSQIPEDVSISEGSSNLARIALWVALIAAAASAFFFYRSSQQIQQQKEQLQQDNIALQSQLDLCIDQLERLINQPETNKVKLEGTPASPQSRVFVFWNEEEQQTFLLVDQLPPAPPGQQYQLWAIVGDSQEDAGILTTDSIQQMKAIEEAEAFAITLEPEGGSKEPSLDKLLVIGNVI